MTIPDYDQEMSETRPQINKLQHPMPGDKITIGPHEDKWIGAVVKFNHIGEDAVKITDVGYCSICVTYGGRDYVEKRMSFYLVSPPPKPRKVWHWYWRQILVEGYTTDFHLLWTRDDRAQGKNEKWQIAKPNPDGSFTEPED